MTCFACIFACVPCVCLLFVEASRACWIPWNTPYRWWWAAVWVLGIQHRSSGKAVLLATEPIPTSPSHFLKQVFLTLEPTDLASLVADWQASSRGLPDSAKITSLCHHAWHFLQRFWGSNSDPHALETLRPFLQPQNHRHHHQVKNEARQQIL